MVRLNIANSKGAESSNAFVDRGAKGTAHWADGENSNESRRMLEERTFSGPLTLAKLRYSARFSIGSAENL